MGFGRDVPVWLFQNVFQPWASWKKCNRSPKGKARSYRRLDVVPAGSFHALLGIGCLLDPVAV